MGIKDFTKTFASGNVGSDFTFKKIKGKRIAVDAYVSVYQAFSTKHRLTNGDGESTQHIKTILNNACRAIENGITEIWCIDSRAPPAEKEAKLEERKIAREALAADVERERKELEALELSAKGLTPEQLEMLGVDHTKVIEEKKARIITLENRSLKKGTFNKYMEDLIRILTGLGVAYCTAPAGIEAEQLGAKLAIQGLVDGVMTTDTDAIVFGAPWILKKNIGGKSGTYTMWDRAKILVDYELTNEQFVTACIALGSDYAGKTPKVGPATVIKKVKAGLELTDSQRVAHGKFMIMPEFTPVIVRPTRTAESVAALKKWLVEENGFGLEGVNKLFAKFETA